MKLPAILRHRFVAVPLLLAGVALVWNIYVAMNNGGIIEGTVIDPGGRPVPGATVLFFERSMLNYVEQRQAVADAQGRFRFEGMKVHVGDRKSVV